MIITTINERNVLTIRSVNYWFHLFSEHQVFISINFLILSKLNQYTWESSRGNSRSSTMKINRNFLPMSSSSSSTLCCFPVRLCRLFFNWAYLRAEKEKNFLNTDQRCFSFVDSLPSWMARFSCSVVRSSLRMTSSRNSFNRISKKSSTNNFYGIHQLDWSIRCNYCIHVQSVVDDESWGMHDDFLHVLFPLQIL